MTSTRSLAIALAMTSGLARADDSDTPTPASPAPAAVPAIDAGPDQAVMLRIRELYEAHDYLGVRRELLAAYKVAPHPSLLFALGQVELNLENYQAAIDYYDRFIATHPPQDQLEVALQARGAATIQLAKQKPRRHRHWYLEDTGLVALGGLAVAVGTGLFVYGRHIGNDHSGSLNDYDARADRGRTMQYSGAGIVTAGALTIGVTILRWRLRPEDGDGDVPATTAAIDVSSGGASVIVSHAW